MKTVAYQVPNLKEDTVFYYKKGRRYVPISVYSPMIMDSIRNGCHLIIQRPGSKTTIHNVEPAHAPLIAAASTARDQVVRQLVEASRSRPTKQPLTKKQIAAWRNFEAAMDGDLFSVTVPAAQDIIDAAVNELIAVTDKLLKNPMVKKAYDEFLFVAKLAADDKDLSNEQEN